MLTRLTEHVYCHPCEDRGDRPNIGYIVGERGALLFEAGNSPAHAESIRAELREAGLPQPGYIALSHWHWDHSYGLHTWEGVTIAGKQTNEKLREMAQWQWTLPAMEGRVASGEEIFFCHVKLLEEYGDPEGIQVIPAQVEFTGELTLDLGGVTCRLLHVEGPHSADSVACLVEEDKLLFLGDSNSKDLYGLEWEYDPAHDEDLVPTLMSLPFDRDKLANYRKLIESLEFTHCIGGHAPGMTRRELLDSLN